ncbi:MAG: mannonate dehydratase [Phycisphaerae bacterium]
MTQLLPQESLRWFGPNDPVPLAHLRQSGATHVFTALHQIPYGEVWPRDAIRERKHLIEAAGLRWNVVESLPIHEDIKTGRGDLKSLFQNYTTSMQNLAAEADDSTHELRTIIYNFMPVLDWIRTDMQHTLPDGSRCMHYDPVKFAAFELFALNRPAARNDFTEDQLAKADNWWHALPDPEKKAFIQNIIDVFPGQKWGLSLDHIRAMLARYDNFTPDHLLNNLARFLEAVIPTAEKLGIHLAIHPDDPPFPVLGLPRIVSTAPQLRAILNRVNSPHNGICFCTGSLSARPDNDLPQMFREFAPRIHVLHLRSTQRLPDGSFYEADHLAGSANISALAKDILAEQNRRHAPLPFRPDHGHVMLDDLQKTECVTPGYSAIGRLRGLAELRGLFLGLSQSRSEF